jgi:DNA-binding NarL/FixJ family response regulator
MTPDLAARTQQDQPTDAVVRTIIADDERLAREKLRLLLGSEPSVEVVAECDDGTQTVSAVRSCHPDLLLLDIQMPGLDGFQVLRKLSPPEMPVVIFYLGL